MYKKASILFLLLFSFLGIITDAHASTPSAPIDSQKLYKEMGLSFINYQAFSLAIAGYNQISGHKKEILTLIDFSKASTDERLYVLDLKNKKLLFKTHVAHGRNSGANYATSFSNKNGSYKSSLGFYLTAETYQGKNGYSLKLDGLEKGINDNARQRAIVMHGASYADPASAKAMGRLGRSLGCPALPLKYNKQVINTIKEGSVLFIYAQDKTYANASRFSKNTIPNWFAVNGITDKKQEYITD